MERSRVIFGNEMSGSVYNKAVKDKTIDVVVEIFNNVNSGGTKLSKGDLALAKICGGSKYRTGLPIFFAALQRTILRPG